MTTRYFFVTNSKDGIDIAIKTREELLNDILSEAECHIFISEEELLSRLGKWKHVNIENGITGDGECFIIKGEIIMPKPKEVVKEYEVE